MRMPSRVMLLAWGCLVILAGRSPAADDWPQWRGPSRDGHIPGFEVPAKSLNQLWKVEVGKGYSSPVVEGGRVFVLTRQDENEVVRALRLTDGKELWSQSCAAPFTMSPYATSHGKWPKATPVIAGGRLYTLGIGGILSCWDAASGKRLWQHDFAKKYSKSSSIWYGAAASPVIEGDALLAFVGVRDQGALVALDCRSGETRWQWEGDGAAYASPVVVTLGGARQVVTQSQNNCIGVSAADGSLLWSLPFTTEYDQNIITPVIAGELVIFGGLGQPTAAYRLNKAGGKWSPARVWENKEITLYMSTPVLVGDRLVGLANRKKGQFFCLDAATGKTLWTSEGRMGDYAVLMATKDRVLAQTGGGELIVFNPSDNHFQPISRTKLSDSPTWAQPAVVGSTILVKDQTSLTALTIER